MEPIYLMCYAWKKHILNIKRVSLGRVWKSGEPQANNWLNTRKCALKRMDWAIEDGIIIWWVAAGSGEGLALKLSPILQSLPEVRKTETKLLGWSYGWVLLQPGSVISRCPVVGGRLCFVSHSSMCSPEEIFFFSIASYMNDITLMWELLQLHACAIEGLCCSGSTGVILMCCYCPRRRRLCFG